MESLKNILNQNQSASLAKTTSSRLLTYMRKKHDFVGKISFSGNKLIIHARNASLATVLRLDKDNLEQVSGRQYQLVITVRDLK